MQPLCSTVPARRGFRGGVVFSHCCSVAKTRISPRPRPRSTPYPAHWLGVKTVAVWTNTTTLPDTEGYTETLLFKADSTLLTYRDDSLANTDHYLLFYESLSPPDPGSDSLQVVRIGPVRWRLAIRNDTLVLDNGYVDGPRCYYVRR